MMWCECNAVRCGEVDFRVCSRVVVVLGCSKLVVLECSVESSGSIAV